MKAVPALALLLALAPAAAAGDPEHPLFSSGDEDWMELRGGIEAGVRAVTGREGRYAQDVNLDGGFRLLSADLSGTALEKGLWADAFSLSLRGLGDPDGDAEVRFRADDAYDFRFRADRQDRIYRGAADPNPWDTTRDSLRTSLSVHLRKDLVLHLTEDRLVRTGDGRPDMMYRDSRPFPAAATLDYEGRFHSVGFDGTSGEFRFGGTYSSSRAEDDAVRVLDDPTLPPGSRGRYRNESTVTTEGIQGRAGLRLWKGRADLSASGGFHASETGSTVRGTEAVPPASAPGLGYDDLRARTEANGRGWNGRAELLLVPAEDWELLARHESRFDTVLGDADILARSQYPVFDPAAPFSPLPASSRSEAGLTRDGVEARWRASKAWRLRAGVEQVRERIVSEERDPFFHDVRTWDPTTVAGTGGFDWLPSERFDASVLARAARARSAATALSMDEGDSLSVRLRARRPDGWHATAFARVKEKREDSRDAHAGYDSFGYSMGNAAADHSLEFTISRERLSTAADTRFVVDGTVNPVPSPHRVSYDEAVTAFTADISQDIRGPLRAFGSLRWADGTGDAPYVQSDLTLGLGWKFTKDAELRLEGRRVAYLENDRSVDDYSARIWTLSVAWRF